MTVLYLYLQDIQLPASLRHREQQSDWLFLYVRMTFSSLVLSGGKTKFYTGCPVKAMLTPSDQLKHTGSFLSWTYNSFLNNISNYTNTTTTNSTIQLICIYSTYFVYSIQTRYFFFFYNENIYFKIKKRKNNTCMRKYLTIKQIHQNWI